MAKKSGAGQTAVFRIDLNADDFLAAVREVAKAFQDLKAQFAKPMSVKIDTSQFASLKRTFAQMSEDITHATQKSGEEIVKAINKLATESKAGAEKVKVAQQGVIEGLHSTGDAVDSLKIKTTKYHEAAAAGAGTTAKMEELRFANILRQGKFTWDMLTKAEKHYFEEINGHVPTQDTLAVRNKKGKLVGANVFLTGEEQRDILEAKRLAKADEQAHKEEIAQYARAKKSVDIEKERGRQISDVAGQITEHLDKTYEKSHEDANKVRSKELKAEVDAADKKKAQQYREVIDLDKSGTELDKATKKSIERNRKKVQKEYSDRVEFNAKLDKLEADRQANEDKAYRAAIEMLEKEAIARLKAANMGKVAPTTSTVGQQWLRSGTDLRRSPEELENAAKVTRELKKQSAEHDNIANKMVANIARAVRLWVTYRLISKVAGEIKQAFDTVIQSGIEYTKNVETQRLGIQGILAENFKISDQQGNQLTGAVALSVLQEESAKQWRQMQSASLSVVGTTEDLVTVYSSILPFASRLGKNLADVQQMTKGTAVAASLMGISFQDARTAMVALLQGRAPSRNRLVGMLGLTPADVKDQSTRFAVIMNKLEEFNALAGDASKTLAASTETIKEFVAMIGAAFVGPGVDEFKKFVQYVTKALFDINRAGDFLPTAAFQSFLNNVGYAAKELLTPLSELGHELVKQGANDANQWLTGIVRLIQPLITLTAWFARAAMAIINFAATHELVIKLAAAIGTLYVAFVALRGVANALNASLVSNGVMGALLNSTRMVKLLGIEASTTTSATGALTAATVGLGTAIRLLVGSTIIGALLVGISLLIEKWLSYAQAARDAAEVNDLIAKGDLAGASAKNSQQYKNDPVGAAWQDSRIVKEAVEKASSLGLTDVQGANALAERWDKERAQLEKDLERVGKQILTLKGDAKAAAVEARAQMLRRLQDLTAEQHAAIAALDQINAVAGGAEQAQRLAIGKAEESNDLLAQRIDPYAPPPESKRGDTAVRQRYLQGLAQEYKFDPGSFTKKQLAFNAKLEELAAAKIKEGEIYQSIYRYALLKNEDQKNMRAALDAHGPKLDPLPQDEPEPLKRPSGLVDSYDEDLKTMRSDNAAARAEDLRNVALARSIEERARMQKFADDEETTRQDALTKKMKEMWIQRRKDYDNIYLRDVARYNSQDNIKESQKITPAEQKEVLDRIKASAHVNLNDIIIQEADRETQQLHRADEFAKALAVYNEQLNKKEAELAHQKGNEAIAAWKKSIETQQLAFLENPAPTPEQADQAQAAIDRGIAMTDQIQASEDLDSALASTKRNLEGVGTQERMLEQSFKKGTTSTSEYAKQITLLRNQTRQLINDRIALLETQKKQFSDVPEGLQDKEKIAQLTQEIEALKQQLGEIKTKAELARDAFTSMVDAAQAVGNLVSALFGQAGDQADGFREKLQFVIDTFQGMIQAAQSYLTVIDMIKKAQAAFQTLKAASTVVDTANSAASTTSQIAEHAGTASKVSSLSGGFGGLSYTGWGLVAVAAIYVGIALYNRAIKKAVERINEGMKAITDAYNDGIFEMGEAQARLERERERQVRNNSNSKAGQHALRDTKQAYDDTIREMEKKRRDATKAFDERLQDAMAGDGAFGDFTRMLMELGKTSQEYLDMFKVGTVEYSEALGKIHELFNVTLANARKKLQEEFDGFESEAIDAAEKVISALEERAQLFEQLQEEHEQLVDLEDQRHQLIKDEAKAQIDLAKEREEKTKNILDLEKDIADTIKKAADDEMTIRQRGVLEGTSTIAQTKASDIAKVRSDAKDTLTDLRKQLAEARDWTEFNDKVAETTKNYEKQTKELDKQYASTIKALANTEKQLRLNEIQIGTAQAIAGMYGTVFNISGDIYDLETRRSAIEINSARSRMAHWQDVKLLIDSIADTANGIEFTPPTGFPKIDITIGDIVIDNSLTDNSDTVENHWPDDSGRNDDRNGPVVGPAVPIPGSRYDRQFGANL